MKNERVKLSSPWETIHHMLAAIFADDEEIQVGDIDESNYTMTITVYNDEKFKALSRRLRQQYELGNITLTIILLDAVDDAADKSSAKDLETIFAGNKFFSKVESVRDFMGFEHNYCLFSREILQYYNDNITDPNGFESKLMQDVAGQIFNINDVNWCTELEQQKNTSGNILPTGFLYLPLYITNESPIAPENLIVVFLAIVKVELSLQYVNAAY